jgi:hypothetical protein
VLTVTWTFSSEADHKRSYEYFADTFWLPFIFRIQVLRLSCNMLSSLIVTTHCTRDGEPEYGIQKRATGCWDTILFPSYFVDKNCLWSRSAVKWDSSDKLVSECKLCQTIYGKSWILEDYYLLGYDATTVIFIVLAVILLFLWIALDDL